MPRKCPKQGQTPSRKNPDAASEKLASGLTVFALHLVFVTKYRRKVFDGGAIKRLKLIFEKVCSHFEAQLVEMNGEAEHVHLLINYLTKHSVSSMVNSLKGVSRSEEALLQQCRVVARLTLPPVVVGRPASFSNTLSNKGSGLKSGALRPFRQSRPLEGYR
jgi:hypothetical protein